MGLATTTLNKYSTYESIKELTDGINIVLPQRDDCKIYPLQMKCAIEGLKMFDGNLPRPYHLVIQGKTQGGKTGVLASMIMLIAGLELEKSMSIKDIYYITGDNSCKLLRQTEERISECFNNDNIHCNFHCLKNSDLKDDITNKTKLTNAMIFVDESHYGTGNEKNIVIQWLESKGLDMHNSSELVDKRVYIVSNSATPYGEINSDTNVWKSYVKLETNDWDGKNGYVGFKEYEKEGCFVPVKHGINKSNAEEMCIIFSNRLKEIYETTNGKKKCAIVRMTTDTYKKTKAVLEKYFHVETFFSKNENISYAEMENWMEHHCEDYWPKPVMLIIAGAYRMGVSIPPYCKKHIGVVFDFATGNGKNSVITTEQGLMGRVTGYWNCNDWYDMTIYINEKHYNALKGCYIEHAISTPMADAKKCFVADENGTEIGIVSEDNYITIPCTEKFEDKEYNLKIKEYLEGENGFKKIGKDIEGFVWFPGRRNDKRNKVHFSEPSFNTSEHSAEAILKREDSANKVCYTTLYDVDENVIKVKYGKIVRGNYKVTYDVSKKVIPTMTTD